MGAHGNRNSLRWKHHIRAGMAHPYPTIIPGLRRPFDPVNGLVYFGRMLDKRHLDEGRLKAGSHRVVENPLELGQLRIASGPLKIIWLALSFLERFVR